jgi:hypothetical protein
MTTHLHRLVVPVLLLSGFLGVVALGQPASPAAIESQHRDFMLGLLSALLILSAFVPRLRLPVIAASVLSKVAFIAVAATTGGGGSVLAQVWLELLLTAALVAAGAVLWREARQEARWHGVVGLRPEA